MQQNKLFALFFVWVAVIAAYIIMAATMPAINSIVQSANATIAAQGLDSDIIGVQEAISGYPLYAWFIPGIVGVIVSVIMLRQGASR